jgi:hypothetical protein
MPALPRNTCPPAHREPTPCNRRRRSRLPFSLLRAAVAGFAEVAGGYAGDLLPRHEKGPDRVSTGQALFISGAEGIRTPDLLIANGRDLPLRARFARRSVSIRSASSSPSTCSTRSLAVRTATTAIEWASWASVLRLLPVSNSRTRAASFAGMLTTCSPDSRSRCATGRPAPFAPSTAQIRSGHDFTYLRIAADPDRPFWSHASSRHPTGCKPEVSHTRARMGSLEESVPPSTWTESGQMPALPRSL